MKLTQSLKIGVLTFHRCINYGSYWQARYLVDALRQRGHDAVLLDHYSERVNMAEWRCALTPVLPTHVPASDYPLYKQKTRKFFDAFDTLPLSPCFPLDDPSRMDSYDLVIVGSDEVWNLWHPWYGHCSLFYGQGVRADRLASYAASFGNYPANEGLGWWWADQLRRFEAISVRDENSREIVKSALGIDPQMALDPCLQFAQPPEGEWQDRPPWADEPYVAVYGHNFSGHFGREVSRWADQQGYRLVSIGYRNDWADEQWITSGPDDFAHFMAHAQAIATNFFHGCVFALVNHKPFVCEHSAYRSIKLQNLIVQVGGEHRLMSEDTPSSIYAARLAEPVRPAVLERIACLREQSTAYLDSVLRDSTTP